MKVGHASREFKEAISEAQKDIRNKNSMMDARFVCGDRKVAKKFISGFLKYCRSNQPASTSRNCLAIRKEKEEEEEERFFCRRPASRMASAVLGITRILWMTKAKFERDGMSELIARKYLSEEEAKSFEEAYSFLLRVRNELHFRSKRPVDVLHLEKQPEVAQGLGYPEGYLSQGREFHGRLLCQSSNDQPIVLDPRATSSSMTERGSTSSLSFSSVLRSYRSSPVEKMDGFELREDQLTPATLRSSTRIPKE